MGLKDLLSRFSGNKEEFKQKLKNAQEDLKIQKTIEERQKSSNERELEKCMKQQREDRIKNELDKIHKQQNSDNWKSPNMILGQKTTILKNDRPILMEKNIFLDNKTKIPITNDRMFFKW
jgi:predicted Holliday junction resolvase-like endonuclease